jgi:murein DD-endopeptidase MepM/ murein hydrolase activator NlpD
MSFNPFKNANLDDLQNGILTLLAELYSDINGKTSEWLRIIRKKGNERITLMFIPHSEKKIVNFHISMYTIAFTVFALTMTIFITSFLIMNHTSTIKEVDKLTLYGSDYQAQIEIYKTEINRLYNVFQKLKPELKNLFALNTDYSSIDLFAEGGSNEILPLEALTPNPDTPSLEALNFEKIENNLKVTREALTRFKSFMENRRKIIESTPSIWPVSGYIVAPFGKRVSAYTSRAEYSNGIDIAAFPGAEIRATAPGTVEGIMWDNTFGLRVLISHKYGFTSAYSHCQRVSVTVGQKVSKGEVIAYVGRTGKAPRHIVHYQIRIGTDPVDPVPYLNKISQENITY